MAARARASPGDGPAGPGRAATAGCDLTTPETANHDSAVRGSRRDEQVLSLIQANGAVTVTELSEQLLLTPSSVRRILGRLTDRGSIVRTYGGAASADRRARRATTALAPRRRPEGRSRVVPDGQSVARTSDVAATEFARRLADQVRDTLRAQILRGDVRPGQRLDQAELARSFGVSLGVVKDACGQLQAEGLILTAPRLGTIVAPVTETDIREVYQLRRLLEPAAARIAAATLSRTELDEMADLVARIETSVSTGYDGIDAYLRELEMDAGFHAHIVRGVRNERLNAFYATIQAGTIVARVMYPRQIPDPESLKGGHRRILEALERRDGEGAWSATDEHLREAEDEAIAQLAATTKPIVGEPGVAKTR